MGVGARADETVDRLRSGVIAVLTTPGVPIVVSLAAGGLLVAAVSTGWGWMLGLIAMMVYLLALRLLAVASGGATRLPRILLAAVACGGVAYGTTATDVTGVNKAAWVLTGVAVMTGIAVAASRRGLLRPVLAGIVGCWLRQVALSGHAAADLIALGQTGGPIMGAADLGGPLLVTGLTILVGSAVARAVPLPPSRTAPLPPGAGLARRPDRFRLLACLVVVLVVCGAGWVTVGSSPQATAFSSALKIRIPQPSFAAASRAYVTNLTELFGVERRYPGLTKIHQGGPGVYVVSLGGGTAGPWSRSAVSRGARILVLDPAGKTADGDGIGDLQLRQAQLAAVSADRTVVLLGTRRPVVVSSDGYTESRGLPAVAGARAHLATGTHRSRDLYMDVGDGPLLALALVGLLLVRSRRVRRRTPSGCDVVRVGRATMWAGLMFALLVGGGSVIGMLVEHGPSAVAARAIDDRVTTFVVRHQDAGLLRWASHITTLAHPPASFVLALVIGVVLKGRSPSWTPLIVLVGSALGAEVLTAILKVIVDRPAPYVSALGLRRLGSSYPSGHATEAAAVAMAVLGLGRRRSRWNPVVVIGGIGLLWAVVVAAARVYELDHYLTDVGVGLLLGGIWAVVVVRTVTVVGQPPASSSVAPSVVSAGSTPAETRRRRGRNAM